MLDGAGASTFLDLIDERNQEEIKKNSKIIDTPKENNEVPFANTARDQNKKNVVFIDSAVSDYETIINSFKENTEFYLINSNEDGFKRISEILNDRKDIDGLHIIGHGSAGEILFGNAFLNNETIDNYQATLTSIGQSLTTSGDILFYGCNVASTDQGEILIKKISEITKADIAASDDITGKGGDWNLEKMEGFVDVKKLRVEHYDHSLGSLTTTGVIANSGVTHIDTNVEMIDSGNVGLGSTGATSQLSTDHFGLVVEKKIVSVSSGDLISDVDVDQQYTLNDNDNCDGSNAIVAGGSNQNASTSMTVNSYLLLSVFNDNRRSINDAAEVVFDGEIVGVLFDQAHTRAEDVDGNTFHSSSLVYAFQSSSGAGGSSNSDDTDGGRIIEGNASSGSSWRNFYNTAITSIGSSKRANDGVDWVAVGDYGSGTNNYLKFGSRNSGTSTGDYIRVLVKVNADPSAVADTGYIQEGKTLTVANSGSAVSGTTTGSNTGDITDNDTDANNDSLTVTHIQHSGAGSSTSVTNVTYNHGSATSVSGTYGTLTIGSDGSYQYVASSDINDLDAGEANVTDVFTYTVSDGNGGTDTETLTINVIPSQDLTARNDTGTVNEDATLTVADGDNANSATALSLVRTTSINSQESYPRDVTFNNDGTKMFTIGATGDDIGYYTLSTAYDTSTATHQADYLGSTYTTAWSLSFNNDGKKLFIVDGDSSYRIYEYSLTTAYDLSTLSLESNRGPFIFSSSYPTGHSFNSDGTKLFLGNTDGGIREYSLSVGFDLSSTFNLVDTLDVSSDVGNNVKGIEFNDDGTKMFVSSESAKKLYQYDLSTGFDLTGATLKKELLHNINYVNGFEFKPDGSQVFLAKSASGTIYTYDVESPYELKDVNDTHSGDVIHTSSTDNYDTDPDSDTLTVTAIRTGSSEGSGTAGSVGSALTGTYGQLTIAANGSYTYVANQDAADALDPGDVVTDTFNYTVSDGQGETDIATITITVIGMNDTPVAVADTDSVDAGSTVTDTTNSAGTLVSDDTDPDTSSSLYVTKITGNGNTSNVTYNSTKTSNAATIVGSKGTLTFGSDGSYSYAANSNATPGDDVFTYTLTDGTATTTSTLTITINNAAPSATVDTGYIQEGKTLTVANGASANDADSSSNNNDATGDHTGDVLGNDTDANGDSLTITTYTHTSSAGQGGANTTPGSPANGTAGTDSVAGTYGTLDLEANGSYTYTANSNITNLDVDDETFTDVFTYTVSDGNGGTATATITITIEASGDVTARNDTGTVNEDATLTVSDGNNVNSITTAATTYSADDAKSISDQENNAAGLAFSKDGLKMFHAGNDNDDIHEYTLTSAFDVSSASYVDSLDVSARDAEIFGITFNNDGTKLYFTGANSADAVFQYTLSTAYDISSGTYDNVSLSAVDSRPCGIRFNNDGTKLFISGFATARIEEYSLSTAFNLATASYTGNSERLNTSTYETSPRDIEFNSDGTRLFITGGNGDDITEYELSTAFDVSTATYHGEYDTSSQDGNTFSLRFNNDGSKMFMLGYNSDKVHEYNLASPYNLIDISGEHSGDVINTSSTANYDTDPDSDTLTVTAIRTGSSEGSGTAGSVGSALTGTYGQLTIAANGSYTYVANQDAADALDPGDVVTDTFNYTVSDGQGETDIAVLTITVNGINDAPVADAETGSVDISQTLTVTDGTSDLLHGDTDADASASLSVSSIVATTASGSATAVNPGTAYNSGYTSVTGSKGTLRVGADGTYQYIAGSSTGTDVFTYTLSDGTATHTATLTITVSGNNAPTAVNDTDAVNEDATITESSGSELLVADDTDADSDTLTVTQIKVTGGSNSSVAGSSTYNSNFTTVTGTYGTLKVGADGSYTYVADQSAADDLDASDTVTDSFTYTVSDGTDTDTATLIITVTGVNDAPVADDETGAVNEDATLTVTDGTSDVLHGDTDADDSASLTATTYSHTSATNQSGGSASSGNGNSGTAGSSAVVGYYGTLTLAADGTYTYAADQSAADLLDASDTVTDVFTYTLSDGTATDTATITITVTGVNDAPVAQNDTGTVNEDATLTVSNSGNATSVAGASHDGTPYAINEGSIRSLTFNHDGTKMFVVHASTPAVISEHALTTAFDITTASQSTTYDVSSHTTSPRGLRFNS
ncbi:Ig-like domain-containing protein, partial [Candidatus Pelagibacter sp.]|nr:Ig-like domain-containing protein [Candidatus Pelagibacter sp.]